MAGPVSVCAFMTTSDVLEEIGRVKDSKALTPRAREEWFEKLTVFKKEGRVNFVITSVGETMIDAFGIVPSIKKALEVSLQKLAADPVNSMVLLDGGLQAPAKYMNQRTIVRGDASETVIALASIMAKVYRDRLMTRMAEKYPEYGFEKHKGYGTAAHYAALKKHGPSVIHRRSFIKNLVD